MTARSQDHARNGKPARGGKPKKAGRPGRDGKAKTYTLDLRPPAGGRSKKSAVFAVSPEGNTLASGEGNLGDHKERDRLARVFAQRLGVKPEEVAAEIEKRWHEKVDERRRVEKAAADGDPAAAPEEAASLLDAAPPTVRRPLCLVDGVAYAATWVHVRRVVRREFDLKANSLREYDQPKVMMTTALVVVRGDGAAFSDSSAGLPGVRPLAELGLPVVLPHQPAPDRCWSGAGLKRYLAGHRPDPADVFRRSCAVVDRFIDFDRSLAPQAVMCELVACYALATYLLDAFHVIGYFWSSGDSGCGKTTLLLVFTELAYLGQLILAGGSYATLRDLADYGAALAFDDAEAVMDPRRTDPDKRTLLLAGNRKGATVTVKEKGPGDVWVTRHVNCFCPRCFSAIRLPDEVLGSRSIILPLVRSGDPVRAKSNPGDHATWPCDRRQLLDDLWGLGLAHLPELPHYDAVAARRSTLSGRDLEPWRAVLAVALWLQEAHGVAGLHGRLEKLSVDYQQERAGLAADHQTKLMMLALVALSAEAGGGELVFGPGELAQRMNDLLREGGPLTSDLTAAPTNAWKVGWELKRKRFRRSDRSEKGKKWRATREEVVATARAYGVTAEEIESVGSLASAGDAAPDEPHCQAGGDCDPSPAFTPF
jgi:hypothetical protein